MKLYKVIELDIDKERATLRGLALHPDTETALLDVLRLIEEGQFRAACHVAFCLSPAQRDYLSPPFWCFLQEVYFGAKIITPTVLLLSGVPTVDTVLHDLRTKLEAIERIIAEKGGPHGLLPSPSHG